MIGQVIKTLITGQTTDSYNAQYEVYNLVGANVFPNVVPQNYGTPAIVYTITDTDTHNIKTSRAPATTLDLDIDVLGESYSIVTKIAALIIANLHRYKNNYNSNNDTETRGTGIPNTTNTTYGRYAPACTGDTQYIAGMSIIGVNLINSIEDFDEKLELYRNTINFKLTYLEGANTSGAIIDIDVQDLNLMQSYSGSDPKYSQPIAIDGEIATLFSKSIFSNNNYQNFASVTGERPEIKTDSNGLNYIDFSSGDIVQSEPSNLRDTYFGKCSIFCVVTLPDSIGVSKSGAIIHNQLATYESGCLWLETVFSDPLTWYYVKLRVLTDSGTQDVTLYTTVQWVAGGTNADLDWSQPNYIYVNINYVSPTSITGQIDCIFSSMPSIPQAGDVRDYYTDSYNWSATGTDFASDLFNFESLHSKRTGFSDAITLYDFAFFNNTIDLGTPNYMQIKKYMISKYSNMLGTW